MKIAILSRKPSLYSTRRLKESAEKRGHNVQIINYLRCYMNIASLKPTIIYQGKTLDDFDAVIPRIGATHTFYGTAVVRQFEMMGVYCVNRSQAIARSRDKLRSLQLLARRGLELPVTGCAHSTKDVLGLVKSVGGAPLVVKLLEGTQGLGVVLADTDRAAESVIEAFRCLDANIIVQHYIKEAAGVDIRCFVVGGRVVAAMKRQSSGDEFRANLHRGASAEQVKLTPQERELAEKSARAMGLNVAGVDLLRAEQGPVVIEINSSPGLQGIETSTQTDVAEKILEYMEKHASGGHKVDRRA